MPFSGKRHFFRKKNQKNYEKISKFILTWNWLSRAIQKVQPVSCQNDIDSQFHVKTNFEFFLMNFLIFFGKSQFPENGIFTFQDVTFFFYQIFLICFQFHKSSDKNIHLRHQRSFYDKYVARDGITNPLPFIFTPCR